MTVYNITFEASSFSVSSDSTPRLGIEVSGVAGVEYMAIQMSVNGPDAHARIAAFGKLPTKNRLPVPAGTIPTWSGFNEAVVKSVMDADSLGVTLSPVAEGSVHITASVEGFMPAVLDIEVGAEKVDHFEIEIVP